MNDMLVVLDNLHQRVSLAKSSKSIAFTPALFDVGTQQILSGELTLSSDVLSVFPESASPTEQPIQEQWFRNPTNIKFCKNANNVKRALRIVASLDQMQSRSVTERLQYLQLMFSTTPPERVAQLVIFTMCMLEMYHFTVSNVILTWSCDDEEDDGKQKEAGSSSESSTDLDVPTVQPTGESMDLDEDREQASTGQSRESMDLDEDRGQGSTGQSRESIQIDEECEEMEPAATETMTPSQPAWTEQRSRVEIMGTLNFAAEHSEENAMRRDLKLSFGAFLFVYVGKMLFEKGFPDATEWMFEDLDTLESGRGIPMDDFVNLVCFLFFMSSLLSWGLLDAFLGTAFV